MTVSYRNQHVIVVGAGASGQALVRFLAAHGADVTLSDRRTLEQIGGLPDLAGLPLRFDLGGHDPALFKQADWIAVSPGVPLTGAALQGAIAQGVPVVGEVEIAGRHLAAPIIAVTGTNGKSTTTSLIGEAMQAWGKKTFVGGNLGTPLIEAVAQAPEVVVVELSSFQLETVDRFHPRVALLLNLTPDHLDRYPDLSAYYRAKGHLFNNMTEADIAVLNADDQAVVELCAGIRATKVWFSASGKAVAGLTRSGRSLIWKHRGEHTSFALEGLQLSGEHNIENAMAAQAAAMVFGCPADTAWQAICGFTGLAHRMQLVRELNGVKWYNDSKGTNVGSVLKSLAGLDYPVTLIAGGVDKGGDYAPLRPLLEKTVGRLILIGDARVKMQQALAGSCPISTAESLAVAVIEAYRSTPAGGTVLLSPACSSFDMFSSYVHRGTVFAQLVAALPPVEDQP